MMRKGRRADFSSDPAGPAPWSEDPPSVMYLPVVWFRVLQAQTVHTSRRGIPYRRLGAVSRRTEASGRLKVRSALWASCGSVIDLLAASSGCAAWPTSDGRCRR
jgi:hypothetical protein